MNNPLSGSINQARVWLKKHGQVSERALADTFAEKFDDGWRYDADTGDWLQWVGTHWARKQTLEFLDAVGLFAAAFAKIYRAMGDITHAEATKLQSQRTAAGIERICRGLPSFRATSVLFDRDPWLLGTPGGTVELKTGTLRPARPEDFITMLTRVTPAETEDCARWHVFIDEVTSADKEVGELERQWAGVSLSGDPTHQKLAFLSGSGRNGKNTYADTLVWISGDYGYSTNFEVFMATHFAKHSTEVWSLKGKRMVIASEVPEGATWNTQRIKDLTGNATITARGIARDEVTFARTMTLTLLGNSRPKFKNVDTALKSRLMLVPFDRNFDAEGLVDPQLATKLKEEAPGILRWAINGLLAVLKADGKIIAPARVVADTKDYMAKYDLRQRFIAERVEKAPPEEETLIQDFYAAWKDFAEAKDIDPLNERSMSVWLVDLTKAERGKPRTVIVDGEPKKNLKTLKGFRLKPTVFGM